MKRKLPWKALVLTLVLVSVPSLVVLAKEISSLTISGPGIKGEMKLDGHEDLFKLMDAGLLDSSGAMRAPTQKLGTPYTINVFLDLDGKLLPFIRMDYYPMQPGQAGYVHITGRLDGEALREADEWSVMPLKADDLLRGLLSKHGVELQAAVAAPAAAAQSAPAAEPPAAPAPQVVQPAGPAAPMTAPSRPLSLYVAIAAAGVILLAGAGLLLGRQAAAS